MKSVSTTVGAKLLSHFEQNKILLDRLNLQLKQLSKKGKNCDSVRPNSGSLYYEQNKNFTKKNTLYSILINRAC